MEEAAMEEAARESPLRGSRTAKTKTSVLRIDRHGRPEQLGPALMSGLRAAGCCNMALLVVSRAFQSRRPVSVLAWCLQREDFADFQVAVLPYSWEPRAVYLEDDCQQRGEDVLLEAQLLTEMNPTVWLEEEGQEAEVALSRLLLAHPKPRQHWHEGFYSKHFKDARLQGAHCEWFRWERPAPISAESHAKAALTRCWERPTKPDDLQGMETVAPDDDDDDDEDLPPLVSHEQT
ncbi:unnamed protein product [Effrenium voratum]|nr:unnamed protein product [Effrenium voratum]